MSTLEGPEARPILDDRLQLFLDAVRSSQQRSLQYLKLEYHYRYYEILFQLTCIPLVHSIGSRGFCLCAMIFSLSFSIQDLKGQ